MIRQVVRRQWELLAIAVIFLIAGAAQAKLSEKTIIDHAFLQHVHNQDTGTIRVFIRNEGDADVRITSVKVNGFQLPSENLFGISIDKSGLKDQHYDVAIWHFCKPNPIPPNKIGDLVIKLAKPPTDKMNIELSTTEGTTIQKVIEPVDNPLRMSFVGFSSSYDKVYIFVHNSGQNAVTFDKVYFDIEEVTSLCDFMSSHLRPKEKGYIAVTPDKPFVQGERFVIKVTTKEGQNVESGVTAFSAFPITVEGPSGNYEDKAKELNLDKKPFEALSFGKVYAIPGNSTRKAHYILGCPVHAHGSLRGCFKRFDKIVLLILK